jgi:hypothetical protein
VDRLELREALEPFEAEEAVACRQHDERMPALWPPPSSPDAPTTEHQATGLISPVMAVSQRIVRSVSSDTRAMKVATRRSDRPPDSHIYNKVYSLTVSIRLHQFPMCRIMNINVASWKSDDGDSRTSAFLWPKVKET